MLIKRKPERELAKVTKQIDSASKNFLWEIGKSKSNSSWPSICETYEKRIQKVFENADITEISRDAEAISKFNSLLDKFVRECSSALYNTFYISEKIYTSTILMENTRKFASEVKSIANYFGYERFMTERLVPNYNTLISAFDLTTESISVNEAIKIPSEFDDVKPFVDYLGHPIPIYHKLFNDNLSHIIIKYLKERNNYYI